jgi:glucose/mannose-6-phosphate isomerase
MSDLSMPDLSMPDLSILDDAKTRMKIDPKEMWALVAALPDHIEAAAETIKDLSLPFTAGMPTKASVVITGLGGSAISGDLARAAAGSEIKIPLIVNRDYDLPAFANHSTLVITCSYSGNTEETLGVYAEAKAAGADIVCITSGGLLAELAGQDSFPVVSLPGGLPPRSALGYALTALLGVLRAKGIVPDMSDEIRESVALLRVLREKYRPERPAAENPAKQLAVELHEKIVAVYGSSAIMEAAAYRWRSQIAENAKNMAFHHVLPEMNHNELVGWLHPEAALKNIGVVFLRDPEDHPQVRKRFDLTREVIEGKAGVVREIRSEGKSRLARILSLVYLGDFTSLYMAYLNRLDPTPVAVIEEFESKLK